MTAQIKEMLTYNDQEYGLATEPLKPYLDKHGFKFCVRCTDCWRGYTGDWIIENNKLYLVGFRGWLMESSDDKRNYYSVDMNYLFPDQEKVFAEWFTGEIRIPHGEILKYYHLGYESVYEKDLFLEFKDGCLVGQREIDNRGASRKKNFYEMLKDIIDEYNQ